MPCTVPKALQVYNMNLLVYLVRKFGILVTEKKIIIRSIAKCLLQFNRPYLCIYHIILHYMVFNETEVGIAKKCSFSLTLLVLCASIIKV